MKLRFTTYNGYSFWWCMWVNDHFDGSMEKDGMQHFNHAVINNYLRKENHGNQRLERRTTGVQQD